MPWPYAEIRLQALEQNQNADGGWGYFPGKESWLEPTAYALLALLSEAGPAPRQSAVERGWKLLCSWQRADGGWRPAGNVDESTWGTALAVTLHSVRGDSGEPLHRGVRWLLDTAGAEGSLLARLASLFRSSPVGHPLKYRGWPWRPDTSSWIEPTAQALVALKLARPHLRGRDVENTLALRIRMAEKMILARRCADGGWNYGSREALHVGLPSYPETTGIALVGLVGTREADLTEALRHARGLWATTSSALAKAWLSIALRLHGVALPEPGSPVGRDNLVTALEVLGSPGGGYRLLAPDGARAWGREPAEAVA